MATARVLAEDAPSAPEGRRLLRAQDVAEQLGLSTSHAYRLLRSGAIATVRFGGVVRVTQQALDDFVLQHTEAPVRW